MASTSYGPTFVGEDVYSAKEFKARFFPGLTSKHEYVLAPREVDLLDDQNAPQMAIYRKEGTFWRRLADGT